MTIASRPFQISYPGQSTPAPRHGRQLDRAETTPISSNTTPSSLAGMVAIVGSSADAGNTSSQSQDCWGPCTVQAAFSEPQAPARGWRTTNKKPSPRRDLAPPEGSSTCAPGS